jgi:SAM-dependent methyltransferase
MKDARPHTHCRLCSAELPPPFLDLGETALANELVDSPDVEQQTFPLALTQCTACEHVQLTVAVDPKRLFPPTYPYQSGTSPVFYGHLQGLADLVLWMKPGGRVLDIASNDGTFLCMLAKRGLNAVGVDPCGEIKTIGFLDGREHDVLRGLFPQTKPSGKFDCITALNVFAHVDDLNDFTAGVAELLADGGVFIFEVGYLPDVVEKGLLGCVYHEHVSYHHLRPLQRFFWRRELELYDAERIDSQGGSVRCFVRRMRSQDSIPSDRLCRLLDNESAGLGLSRLEDRADKLLVYGSSIHPGLAGYGAPAKLTTLCAVMGIDSEELTCIFDDNPLKVGKYTPGTRIPIVSSAELMQRNPDALVLFSANFKDEIQSRFPDWRGEWIVP